MKGGQEHPSVRRTADSMQASRSTSTGRATNVSTARDDGVRREIIASTGKTMLVEAAAGTGKTTLIVARMLQSLRQGAFRLPRAVAITYTEKAAGELETRIREGVAQALEELGLSAPEAERLRTAAEELDRAHISTIHAFCARLLREKAAEAAGGAGDEAGVDPEFAVLDQAQALILRERCWRDWMEEQVAECPDALVEVLRAGVSVATLKALAFGLADAPEVLEEQRFAAPVPAQSRDGSVAALRGLAPGVAELFAERMRRQGNDDSRRLKEYAQGIAAARADDDAAVRRLACLAAGVRLDEALKSFAKDEREDAGAALSAFTDAAKALAAHLAADVFTWSSGFVRYYGEQKLARSVLDFQDLLVLTARMLRDRPSVRRYFQNSFDAFFVDEFQDTDPLQAELIAYLCEAPTAAPAKSMEDVRLADGKLFAVGDPKQSIYRFRRADVQIYDRFKGLFGTGAFGEERTRQIYCNFRSEPALIAWFNRLFEALLTPPEEPGAYQAPHVPLEPRADAGPPKGRTVLALCPPPGLSTDEWTAGPARRHEAHYVAYAIRKAVDGELKLGDRPFRYAGFALLLRALTDADFYEEAFDRYGVPYRVVGGKHFYRREQTAETLAVLQAVDDPLNEAAVVGALRSSYLGFSDEDLFRYRSQGGRWNYLREDVFPGAVGEALKTMAAWHRRRNRVPPQVLLREAFDATKAPQAFLLKPAGAQRVANLDKLLNDLRSLGASAGSFGAVVRYLSEVQEAELPEEESGALEPGEDFVRIMSMHKAKGLEFEAVVLPDLARAFRDEAKPLLFNRLSGRLGLRAAPGLETAGYEQLAAEEKANALAEQRRLLYVACTRARRLLMLPLYWRASEKQCFQRLLEDSGCLAAAGKVPYGQEEAGVYYLDTPGWAHAVDVSMRPYQRAAREEGSAEALVAERQRWQESHRLLVRRASAGEPFVLPSAMEAGFEPRQPAGEGAGGRDFGSLFHSLMMVAPVASEPDEQTGALVRNLARIQADGMGLAGPVVTEAGELAANALRNPEFRALVDGADAVTKEVAFTVPLSRLPICPDGAAGLLEGSMDLVVRRGGRTTVLDYKTDRFDLEGRKAVEERYWPQLALYGLAARACGLAGSAAGEVELALFFVRAGMISRRMLDRELTESAAARVAEALAMEDGATP